ncbi:hypothetical protein C8J57DRAFT_1221432 [Mycena rebaudengoi]|nr:hypothetical protein C8J57DRAFT_1221432 [Mycena rebaudengoi]
MADGTGTAPRRRAKFGNRYETAWLPNSFGITDRLLPTEAFVASANATFDVRTNVTRGVGAAPRVRAEHYRRDSEAGDTRAFTYLLGFYRVIPDTDDAVCLRSPDTSFLRTLEINYH